MKIKEINDESITFDDGSKLIAEHDQDCCEDVYADFMHMQVATRISDTNEINVADLDFAEDLMNKIKLAKGVGFFLEARFKQPVYEDSTVKILVSCYNEQNGYYSTDLRLRYVRKIVQDDIKTETVSEIDISECEQDFVS